MNTFYEVHMEETVDVKEFDTEHEAVDYANNVYASGGVDVYQVTYDGFGGLNYDLVHGLIKD